MGTRDSSEAFHTGANVTRENVIDYMNRAAYFGVAAVHSQGIEPG
jgi:hypothetical protein